MCKTRWVERHTCYETFYEMYTLICKCLEAILAPHDYPEMYTSWQGVWDAESRTQAQGLLSSLVSFQTITALLIAKNCLESVRTIATKLQKRDLDIFRAYQMIDDTKENISVLRKYIEEEYEVWFEDSCNLAQLVGSTVSAPRVPRSAKHRPNAPSASKKEYYLRNVAIPFSDHLLSDFSNRFDAESRKGAHLLGLLPGAVTKAEADLAELVNGLLFWESDLPQPTTLRTELKQWQRFWQKKDNVTAVSLKQCLQQADCDVFPNIAVLLKIACTLPVGSCEAERSFSCFRRIKSFLRNNMGEDRVSGLALMNLNHEMEINLDIISGMFAQKNKRRMFTKCILYD